MVGAAQRVEVHGLDLVEVHRDIGDVAEEPDACAVGRHVDVLADVRAVERERVAPGLAFDRVGAVAGVPHRVVAATAEEHQIVAPVAVDHVVAAVADEGLAAEPTEHGVVAAAAVERGRFGVGEHAARVVDTNRVGTAQSLHL